MLDPKNLKNGESQHEEYYSNTCRRNLIQYDYRHTMIIDIQMEIYLVQ